MASKNHSLGVLQYHSQTATCVVSLTLLTSIRNWTRCCRRFLSALCRQPTMNIWQFKTFFPQEPRSTSLPMTINFHSVTLVHALQPLDLVMTQQFFTNMHDWSHLVVEWCTRTTPSDNSHDHTACYSLKQQPLSKSFQNGLSYTYLISFTSFALAGSLELVNP